jgi:PII-like signaling protein
MIAASPAGVRTPVIGDPSFVEGRLLRIFIGEDAQHHGRPLHVAIVEMLRKEGVAGASVFRGIEGFGSHHEIHVSKVFSFGGRMPMVVEVVDSAERIAALLPRLEAMVDEGAITLERIEYRRFFGKRTGG